MKAKIVAFLNSPLGKLLSHSLAGGATLLLTALASAYAANPVVHTVLAAVCPK